MKKTTHTPAGEELADRSSTPADGRLRPPRQHALDALGLPLTRTPGRYGRYLQILDDLLRHGGAHADGWGARDIDTALYWIGKPNRRQAPSP